jgi:protein arginine N-methyltransferase 1
MILERQFRFVLQKLKSVIKSNDFLRKLILDVNNTNQFTDLFIHERMLADRSRVDAYSRGISRHIREGDVIVELGTGTGILSFLAARRSPRKIYAIDHSPFLEIARRIAKHNGFGVIEFVQANSRDFHPVEKADVIIHEQIGNDLFEENMVENLLDLKHRVLKATGRIIPGRFELFIEPACLRAEHKLPFVWEDQIHGIDFGFLRNSKDLDRYKSKDYQNPLVQGDVVVDYLLSDPQAILSFDLNELSGPSDLPKRIEGSKTIARSGVLDGFILYFRASFDDDISFDTSPMSKRPPMSGRTNWRNRLFRMECKPCRAGEVIPFKLTMERLNSPESWSLVLTEPLKTDGVKEP